MTDLNRRALVKFFAVSSVILPSIPSITRRKPVSRRHAPPKFDFARCRAARELAAAPFDTASPVLPEALNKLDFDSWRDIRFHPDKAFLGANGSQFRLQLFHLGHLYQRPVTINIIRDGIADPIPYYDGLFDYGRTKTDKPLPVNLGFAGFGCIIP